MSKIICDICGTSYPETSEQCPICGSARDLGPELFSREQLDEELSGVSSRGKGGRFAAANVRKRSVSRYEPDEDEDEDDDEDEYDEDEDEEDDYDDDDYDEDDEDYDEDDEESKSNTPLVVLLIVVIVALLVATAYIGVTYILPEVLPAETTVPSTAAPTTAVPAETTEPTIPCDSLALTSGVDVLLEQEGQMWLINVLALPENTTDKLMYSSSDESVVTVAEDGTMTAVGEGSAVITITCGAESLQCNVVCDFTQETTAPEEEETTAPTEPEQTTEPTKPLKDVTLRVIYWSDLTFDGPNQGFTFVLDSLTNEEVKWTSMDENVVTVDEKGFVISVGPGKTNIICEYGDQKIEIPVNCRWG